jgi:2-polyprenyl-6-methoxyphenol hydroxylase-like FAD-dependent oxidoreductase
MSLSIGPRPFLERHALVLGGGIAGVAKAAALSRRLAQVTLVERDLYPDGPELRPHGPHGAHVHLLLAGGC